MRAALAAVLVQGAAPELRLAHLWLDNWRGIGQIAEGMHRAGSGLLDGTHLQGGSRMEGTLLGLGLACLIAAIVGGGLTTFGVTIPVIPSYGRQVLLGIVGLSLIVASVLTQRPRPSLESTPSNSAASNVPIQPLKFEEKTLTYTDSALPRYVKFEDGNLVLEVNGYPANNNKTYRGCIKREDGPTQLVTDSLTFSPSVTAAFQDDKVNGGIVTEASTERACFRIFAHSGAKEVTVKVYLPLPTIKQRRVKE